jgi:hypothetical protein
MLRLPARKRQSYKATAPDSVITMNIPRSVTRLPPLSFSCKAVMVSLSPTRSSIARLLRRNRDLKLDEVNLEDQKIQQLGKERD